MRVSRVCLAATLLLSILISSGRARAGICMPPPDGLVAWWPFDESGGSIAQDLAGEHPGVYFDAPAPVVGKVGGALRFDGIDDFVGAADSDLWAFGHRDFTIELWARFEAPVGGSVGHPGATFLGNDEGPGWRRKWFFALGGGVLHFHINDPVLGPQFFPRAPFVPEVGRWYHLAVTRNGSLYTIFVDGAAAGSSVEPREVPDAMASLSTGQAESLGFFRGTLDEISVYSRALSQAEVQALVAADSAGKCKAQSGPTLLGPSPYLGSSDSPFSGLSLEYSFIEDFEDGLLNTPGVTASTDIVGPPGPFSDSVDSDDGARDGFGIQGRTLFAEDPQGITFTFDAVALGHLPSYAGVVWTDAEGPRTTSVFLEAFNAAGSSSGLFGPFAFGDDSTSGTTAEDRFLGVVDPDGISAIRIFHQAAQIEVDHLQYGRIATCDGVPCIANVVPRVGGDIGSVTVRITGNGFLPGSTVRLRRTGYPDILGEQITIDDNGMSLTTTFNLVDQEQGEWGVIVEPPGQVLALILPPVSGRFTIEAGRPVQLGLQVVGRDPVQVGRPAPFMVIVGNSGNVNASDVAVSAALWRRFEEPLSPLPSPLFWWTEVLPVVPPGVSVVLPLPPITVSQVGCYSLKFLAEVERDVVRCLEWLQDWEDRCDQIRQNIIDQIEVRLELAEISRKLEADPGNVILLRQEALLRARLWSLQLEGRELLGRLLLLRENLIRHCLIDPGPCDNTAEPSAEDSGEDQSEFHENDFCTVGSIDPNEKIGLLGYSSTNSVQHFTSSSGPLLYSVLFENLPAATAPAQEVVITDQLDPQKVDLATFALGTITFGAHQIVPPTNRSAFTTVEDLRPEQDLLVRVEASLDRTTGLVSWRFSSIDPATGELPVDPLRGFLPPNVNPHEGSGSVAFTVQSHAGLSTGTEVRNRALITFDLNAPIETQEWLNTLDSTPPASRVERLAMIQSSAAFPVSWFGSDEGAGIKDYSVFVAEGSGAFIPWLVDTPLTSKTFAGSPGRSYSFYSQARDFTGHRELVPTVPDTATQVPPDTDGDGALDPSDNCPSLPNSDQADLDRDDLGNVCDPHNTVSIVIDPDSIPRFADRFALAVLSTPSFDSRTLDPESVWLNPAGARPVRERSLEMDVDHDGDIDLVLYFRSPETGVTCRPIRLSLLAALKSGVPVEGDREVEIDPCRG